MNVKVVVATAFLFILVVLIGAGNLLATYMEVQSYKTSQQKQGEQVEQKLCSTLDQLAALKPPAGNPQANPSRAYDQQLHATLDQLGTDLGCPQ